MKSVLFSFVAALLLPPSSPFSQDAQPPAPPGDGAAPPADAASSNATAAHVSIRYLDDPLIKASLGFSGYLKDTNPGMVGGDFARDTGITTHLTKEANGVLDVGDFHFEYRTSDPNAPKFGDPSIDYYFNIYGENERLSDTLHVTLAYHDPKYTGDAKVSVLVDFRSDEL